MVEGDPAIMKEYKKAEADIIRYLADLARKISLESGADTEEARRAAIVKSIRARAAEQLVAITTLKQLAAKAKAKVAREWVDNFLANDKKLIVFGWHREIVDDIATNFAGGIKIQGGISAVKRQEAVDLFQNSDEQKVIACQIKAAGVGLTLTAASDVLFIEQGWTPGEMDQAVDRSHRIGQQDSVTGWVMIVAETIDEDIARLIEHKRSVVDRAIDGSNLDDEELQQSAETELLVMLAERGLEEDADF
jgi:SWI/SNF-related matrix-associated actin-dependent regulator 1 of chromatin subfamily A